MSDIAYGEVITSTGTLPDGESITSTGTLPDNVVDSINSKLDGIRSYLKTQNNCLFLLIREISSRKILEIRKYFSVFSLELTSS